MAKLKIIVVLVALAVGAVGATIVFRVTPDTSSAVPDTGRGQPRGEVKNSPSKGF